MLYWFVRWLLCPATAALFRVRVIGRENVPEMGAFVVCSNHIAWWDPILVAWVIPRQVSFMSKEELFKYPVFGLILKGLGAFPVKRGSGDRNAIRIAETILSNGGVLGIFPEGTRSRTGELGKGTSGAAYLAIRNHVPLLPVAISGPYRIGGSVTVKIGEPFSIDGGSGRVTSAELQQGGAIVMEAIAGLMDRGTRSFEDQGC